MDVKLYSYEAVVKGHYIIKDEDGHRIATCNVENNAQLIVAALNFLKGVMAADEATRAAKH